MMKTAFRFGCSIALMIATMQVSHSQELVENFLNFDETAEGPWSDIDATTITIPKVANGSIQADADVSAAEYGGFEGIDVIPGDNAWVLGFAEDKEWSGPDDNSFTFYSAYDDDFLYIGVTVKDDVLRSNDPNVQFWKDDAVEVIFGNNPNGYDYNTDAVPQEYGGHAYLNYLGRFSAWLDDIGPADLTRFSIATDWEYSETGDVWGFGQETPGGWTMESRFHKRIIEDPDLDIPFAEGSSFIFNIGMDDDDGADLAIQYWWANRIRAKGFNPENEFFDLLTEEELANQEYLDPDSFAAFWEVGIDAGGRLSTAGAGTMILGPGAVEVGQWSLY